MASLIRGRLLRSSNVKRSFHVLPLLACSQKSQLFEHRLSNAVANCSVAPSGRRQWTSWLGFGGDGGGKAEAKEVTASELLKDVSPSYSDMPANEVTSTQASDITNAVLHGKGVTSSSTVYATKTMFAGPTLNTAATYYLPLAAIQAGILGFQAAGGLPLWGAIAGWTILLRVCMAPVQIRNLKNSIVLHNNMPMLNDIQGRTLKAARAKNRKRVDELKVEANELYKCMGCSPYSSLKPTAIMMPMQALTYFSVRDLCLGIGAHTAPDIATGGFLWAVNMSAPDPLYIMPAVVAGTLLTSMLYDGQTGIVKVKDVKVKGIKRHMCTGFSLVVFACASQFPLGVQVFFCTNLLTGLLLSRVYRLPAIKKLIGVPEHIHHPPGMSYNPFRGIGRTGV